MADPQQHRDDIHLLAGILSKTGALLAGVNPDQADSPTPCPDYDVGALVDHITSWIQVFATGAEGGRFEGDPASMRAGDDPAGEFAAHAERVVSAWRTYGVERDVAVMGGEEMPGRLVLNMTVMEYLGHGWDLARATGQPIPFTEAEGSRALAMAAETLPPQYRGPGMAFGDIVAVADTAPAVDRFVAFIGRDPGSAAAPSPPT